MTSAMSTFEADALLRWPLSEEWLAHLSGFHRKYAIFRISEYRVKLTWLAPSKVFSVHVYCKHPETKRWRRVHWKFCEPEDLTRLYQTWSQHDP